MLEKFLNFCYQLPSVTDAWELKKHPAVRTMITATPMKNRGGTNFRADNGFGGHICSNSFRK